MLGNTAVMSEVAGGRNCSARRPSFRQHFSLHWWPMPCRRRHRRSKPLARANKALAPQFRNLPQSLPMPMAPRRAHKKARVRTSPSSTAPLRRSICCRHSTPWCSIPSAASIQRLIRLRTRSGSRAPIRAAPARRLFPTSSRSGRRAIAASCSIRPPRSTRSMPFTPRIPRRVSSSAAVVRCRPRGLVRIRPLAFVQARPAGCMPWWAARS